MFTYTMDVEARSVWLRTTPGAAALAQPYYCTEAGLFYGRAQFATARTDKESYLLFYTLEGGGLVEQGDSRLTLGPGDALLLNCRAPQSYCTAPGQTRTYEPSRERRDDRPTTTTYRPERPAARYDNVNFGQRAPRADA